MPNVQMPNGDLVAFPDDMPSEQIKGLISAKFPDAGKVDNTSSDQSFGTAYQSRIDQAADNINKEDIEAPFKNDNSGPEWLQRIGDAGSRVGNATMNMLGAASAPLAAGVQTGVVQPIVNAVTPDKVTPEQAEALGKVKQDTSDLASGAILAGTGDEDMAGNLGGYKSISDIRKGFVGKTKELLQNEASGGADVLPTADTSSGPVSDFDPLKQAAKGTGFWARAKDPSATGLEANQSISKAYDTANGNAEKLYGTAKSLGEGETTDASDIAEPLKSTIDDLQSSAVTPAQSSTLRRLKAIQEKYFPDSSATGTVGDGDVPNQTYSPPQSPKIELNDLVEVKQALNEGFKSNDFTKSSEIPLVKLNSIIKGKIDSLATSHPDFVAAQRAADSYFGTEVAAKFKDNDQLAELWQPEDYHAWKQAQDPAKYPGAKGYTDSTLSRAGKMLDNLNSDNEGRVSAVINALPHDDAVNLLHEAILNAKSVTPSLRNVALNLLGKSGTHGAPTSIESLLRNAIGAVTPGQKASPLLDLTNRVSDNGASKLPYVKLGAAATAGDLALTSFGPKAKTDKGQKNGPQSNNNSIDATTNALAASKKNDSFSLSSLNPISDADASEIKVPKNSAITPNVKTFMSTPSGKALQQSIKQHGVSPTEIMTLVNSESSVKHSGGNDYGQMTDIAWKQAQQLTGRTLNRHNPKDYADAVVSTYKWTADQVKQITNSGGTPSMKDVYPAYNAGVSGFKALHNASPSQRSVDVVPPEVAANNKKFYYHSNGSPMTVRQTLQAYKTFVEQKMNEYSPTTPSKATKLAMNMSRN